MENIKHEWLPIDKVVANKGQIAGLPANPRQWTRSDIDRIAKSLDETPELFEARPCIVIPCDDKFVVLGGNLRLAGSKHNGAKQVPCVVLPAETPADKLKEIVIKDNGSFGAWDMDMLSAEWGTLPLAEWGVPNWEEAISATPAESHEDDFDEDKDVIPCRAQKGDIWVCGNHRVMCGDSTDADSVKRLMGGGIG